MRNSVGTGKSDTPLLVMAKLKKECLLPADICKTLAFYLIELLEFKHPAEVSSDRGDGWSTAAIVDKFKHKYKELEENMLDIVRSCN